MPSGLHTFLLIDVQHTRKGPTHHWWLGAEPPCGTHPEPEAACQVLRSFRDNRARVLAGPLARGCVRAERQR